MPKAVEKALRKVAEEKYGNIKNPTLREDKMDAFVYGTMRHRLGWKPKRERK